MAQHVAKNMRMPLLTATLIIAFSIGAPILQEAPFVRIIFEVILCPYDAFLLPHFRSGWQELNHTLANYLWKYSVRLEIYADCNFGDTGVEDYCYDEWSKPDDLHEHFLKILQYEGLREMNNLGRLLLEIKKRPIEFSVR
ncbi:hypothetical protein ARMGADRAFT_1084913 [Armillaria gallica]|uniref:Uncharacterized protein n=1 Tax=Armillaria gallica TaxID=47427 RepID=A0A2H3DAP0_ARMGA|nr:hypothetical protein ARMGADRAFT_1084913 [Armillaria gallica]